MATFTDNKGLPWSIDIKFRDIERVKAHVKGVNGQPVDLLAVAEKGDFSAISGSVQQVLDVVFWLCFDDIMANFDREQWDEDHATLYEMCPEEKRKSPLQKAADWFGERISGDQVLPLVKAWEEAVLNFIPNPRVKEAIQRVKDREEVYQIRVIEAVEKDTLQKLDQSEDQLGASSSNSPAKSASRRKTSPSAS